VNNRIAITWQSFLLFSVISILAVPLTLVDQLSPRNFLCFLGIGIGVTAVIGLALIPSVVFMKSWLSNFSRREQEFLSVVAIGITGVIRGILVHFSIAWFGFTQPTNIWTRIATSTTTTLLWLTVISLFVTSRNSFKSDYEATLRKKIVETSEKIESMDLEVLPITLETELLEIERVLGAAFGDDLPPNSKISLTFAAAHIKNLIKKNIRQHSHRI